LTATRALADYFEAAVKAGAPGKSAANWISTELLRRLNEAGKHIENCPVPPPALAELLAKIESSEITAATGKKVFATMFDTGKRAAAIISTEGMMQITDAGAIEKNRADSGGQERGKCGQVSRRERRRVQVFRGPGDA
jgi:aspartyl-tRNA(Asn)/glutamyl-tRNA(Gln) amidotransferase subunit B